MPAYSAKIIRFYNSLEAPAPLPSGIEVLHPQTGSIVRKLVKQFYQKFYPDDQPRRFIFGINPGRFGAGITGINFTGPRQLKDRCGIDHPFGNSSELSAEFIYEVIDRYGGVNKFYSDYFITAMSPLGYTQKGKNLNYYDDKDLEKAVTPFIIESIRRQLAFGTDTSKVICIGGDKNLKFFSSINEKYQFFKEIIPLPHPRFILQYRRKQREQYVQQYLSALQISAHP